MKTRTIAVSILAFIAALAGADASLRYAGINVKVRYSGSFWLPVHAGDPWVPASIALALRDPVPVATPAPFDWREIAPGFEVGGLPVLAAGIEADRILLARIDPKRFRFVLRNAPMANRNLDAWMRTLNAALVVNGSYFSRAGTPDSPVVIDGVPAGPAQYTATHGAFVSSSGYTGIRDLAQEDWRSIFQNVDTGLVSYPLLIAPDGSIRVPSGGKWLANRSFLGEDDQGRIIVGTTKSAFFSLDRLALFLKQSPLGLRIALNLDGGPVASQGVHLNGFDRRSYGQWEIQVENGHAAMLPHVPFIEAPMPIVLAVYPR